MKKFKLTFAAVAALVLSLSSCNKEETSTPTTTTGNGTVNIEFAHKYGMMSDKDFMLDSIFIHPMKNDTMYFSKFMYYFTNVKLKKADGTYWTETESYHLIDLAKPSSLTISLANVPTGDYTALEYTLGVDSVKNVSGAQAGDLAISNKMFWDWNSGYNMLKAEGKYLDNAITKTFTFHLGGFSGANNVVTKRALALENLNKVTVSANKKSTISMIVNPGLLWHTAPSVKTLNKIHMQGAPAKLMALGDNGATGFGFFNSPHGFSISKVTNNQ
jgi:hypothetical protein